MPSNTEASATPRTQSPKVLILRRLAAALQHEFIVTLLGAISGRSDVTANVDDIGELVILEFQEIKFARRRHERGR